MNRLAFQLVNNLTPTAGQSYQIICTLSAGSVGSVTINFGGVSSASLTVTTTTILTTINATSKLSITPSSSFVGTVSLSIKTSSSALNQIQLPITLASGKSVWIDWGDGQYSTANSTNIIPNRIHTYTTPGEYPVRVFGDNFSFGFGSTNSVNDRLKIKSISSWGKLKIGAESFFNCSNVTMSGITDIPDLTGVTDLNRAFRGCTLITTVNKFADWNTSLVTNFREIFFGCTNFNQDVGALNVSGAFNLDSFFMSCTNFNNGGSSSINNWNVSNVSSYGSADQGIFAGCINFNQPIGNWNVSNTSIFLNMFLGAVIFNNGFASGVANQLPWNINNTAASVNMSNMFRGATAFNSNLGTGTTPWDVSKVTTFANMFSGATAFTNGNNDALINNWNIGGNITGTISMSGMFNNADAFNRTIGGWNMTKVTNTSSMFANTNVFNQPLSNWGSTMGNVTDMSSMFTSASAFNQNIGAWSVSKVTTFANMFNGAAAFNNNGSSDINNWSINTGSNVTMGNMFATASNFNMPISNWNMTKVNNTGGMFNGTTLFNQPLANWERDGSTMGNVTSMSSMFASATLFNQNIGAWNVSKVTIMSGAAGQGMFQNAVAFNNGGSSSIGGWDVSKVLNMGSNTGGMFNGATAFNQPIGDWDVSSVTDMNGMFRNATAFNQNIGAWNVSNVTVFDGFMSGKTNLNFSTTNLDAIYNGWSSLPSVKPNTTSPLTTNISFGGAKYTAAGTPGKNILIGAPNNWIIIDGGI
jgi:surface protein